MRRASSLCAAMLGAALIVTSAEVAANGRLPASQYVLVGPGTGSTTIALRTTFGFIVSDDGGASFHWICESALGYPQNAPFDPPMALTSGRTLLVGLINGVTHVAPDRCSFAPDTALDGAYIADFDQNATGTTVVTVTSSGEPGAINRVYRSTDGATFQPLGAGMTGVLFDTLEMAHTDPTRIYLTGTTLAPHEVRFYRSNDGGATMTSAVLAPGMMLQGAYIAAIDPTNADVVFVRGNVVLPIDDENASLATILFKTTDGGHTFREIARTHGTMDGFAISDDGRTIWIGGRGASDRLQRSIDGGDTWQTLGAQQVLCLRQHAGVLYLCANDVIDHFALGSSTDLGNTFRPLLRFQDIQGPFACSASGDDPSPESTVCGSQWPTLQSMYRWYPPMDGGSEPVPPVSHCGACTTAPIRRPLGALHSTVALAFAALARARRRATTRRRAPEPH